MAGTFTRACNAGLTGNGMPCTAVDECANGTDNCDANATCANTPGAFTCTCAAGYSGNGTTCAPNCGDGALLGSEECDDGDMTPGDGCNANALCGIRPTVRGGAGCNMLRGGLRRRLYHQKHPFQRLVG
jgi:cysteine-rich repeat protein